MANDVKIKVSLDGADGVEKGLNGIGNSASETDSKLGKMVSGGLKGAGVAVLGFATAAVAAGGALTAGVINQFAQYEQNIGGIETMFKSSAGKMEGYASQAYKTAGLSANEYMSQVTSFSAALLQGLGGDTDKAADVANRAMTDMSDNANKFGSNIGDIQNAYQGFAKQNFTMLDNLKLGYGGTAAEMARLVNDAGLMEDGFVTTAENINSVSYDKIIASIGAIQDQMGITGTTAKEASETISGSIGMLKSSFADLLTGLGSADADVATLAGNVITSLQTVVTNITPVIQAIGSNIASLGPQLGSMMQGLVGAIATAIPAVLQAGVALVGGLLSGITSALPSLITALVPGIVGLVQTLATLAPQLVSAGVQAIAALAIGIGNALPQLIPAMVQGVIGMVQALINAAPMLLGAGLTLITGLIDGILQALPMIVAALPVLIEGIVNFIANGVPAILEAAIQLFMGIIQALPQVIVSLVAALPQIITSVITTLLAAIPMIIEAGITLLTSLIGALPEIITTIVGALPEIITNIITAVLGAIPLIIQAGIELLISLVKAMPQIVIAIVKAIPQIIQGIIKAVMTSIPQIIDAGVQLLTSLIRNISSIVSTIRGAMPQIINGIVTALSSGVGQVINVGTNIVRGIWEGISGAAGWLFDQIAGFVDDVMGNIAGFFGIASPSKRMEKEIGVWLPPGIGKGVTENEKAAIQPITDMNKKIMTEASKLKTYEIEHKLTTQGTMMVQMVPAKAPEYTPPSYTTTQINTFGKGFVDAMAEAMRELDLRPEVTAKMDHTDMNYMAQSVREALVTVRAGDAKSAALSIQQGGR